MWKNVLRGSSRFLQRVLEGDTPRVIENSEGARTTPSYVSFENDGPVVVGELARRQATSNPKTTVYATKRLIGRKFNEPEIQSDLDLVSFDIVEHSNGDAWVCVDGKEEMSPSQIGAYILMKMKETAEDYLGVSVEKAVVTVPAYFNNQQKQATKDAGQIAGLDVIRIINEPTAAAMAYGIHENSKDGVCVVFDLGGGTFDVSILDIDTGVFEVRATNGDTHLGGEDFDQELIQYLITEFELKEGIDLSKDALAIQRIKEAAEKAKIELSSIKETVVSLPFIAADETGPKNLEVKITRARFEGLVDNLIQRTIEPCLTCMKDAGIDKDEIDEVILVGGMTRVPKVQEVCEEIFGRTPSKIVNPDEVVACGAALQGAILQGDIDDLVVIDTSPLSLGIETVGGIFTKLIPKNTNIPCEKSETFTTAADNQVNVGIRVFQGEREFVEDNRLLGEFQLEGIPPVPKGVPQIDVMFDIDANGIVNVSAKDKATGKAQQITLESKSGLTEEEILRMEEDAKVHKEQDQVRKDLVNMKNEIDNTINLIEQGIEQAGVDELGEDYCDDLLEMVAQAKEVIDGEDMKEIKTIMDDLKEKQFALSEKVYNLEQKKREDETREREKEKEREEKEKEQQEEENEDEDFEEEEEEDDFEEEEEEDDFEEEEEETDE